MGFAQSPVRVSSDSHLSASLEGLFFREPDTPDLRHREDPRGDGIVLHPGIPSQGILRGYQPLMGRDMGEHAVTGDIPHRVDAGSTCLHAVVDEYLSALTRAHSALLKPQVFGIQAASH